MTHIKIGDTVYKSGTRILVCKRNGKYILFLGGAKSGTYNTLEDINKILVIFNVNVGE